MRELRPRRLAGIRVLIRQAVPGENDGTSRLTNDFDLSFLFFLLCIIAEILRKMRVLCQAADRRELAPREHRNGGGVFFSGLQRRSRNLAHTPFPHVA